MKIRNDPAGGITVFFIRLRRRPRAAYSAVVAYGYEGWMSPWMNAHGGPTVALAKVGAAADSAKEIRDTVGGIPWTLHTDHETTGH